MNMVISLLILLHSSPAAPAPKKELHSTKTKWFLEVLFLTGVNVGSVYGEDMRSSSSEPQTAGISVRLFRRLTRFQFVGLDLGLSSMSGTWSEDDFPDSGSYVFSLIAYRLMVLDMLFLDLVPVLSKARVEYDTQPSPGNVKEGYDLGIKGRIGWGFNWDSFRFGFAFSKTKTKSTDFTSFEIFFGWLW